MSDLAAAIAANAKKKGTRCTVRTLLDNLPVGERADLQAALDNPIVAASAISRGLASVGYEVGQHVITRHRRGDCLCGRDQ
jgi:hypothetical protein